jgi:type VI secretion system protein ImpG
VLARSENDPHPINCGIDIIQAVGFDIEEGLLPYPANAFMGYRLLTEYFVFPQKFMFVDIKLKNRIPADAFGELNLYIYLNQTHSDLEHFVNASSFALGCTPVINLFPHTADPIRLDHTHYDYQIVPDGRRSKALEIYSIDAVKGSDSQGKQYEYTPFYGIQHQHTMNNHGTFWFSKRRNVVEGEHQNEQASECDISLVDLNFDPYQPHDESLDIKLSCLNRNLPSRLPSGTNQPKLFLVEGDAPVSSIHCLSAPGQTIRPPLQNRAHWKLLSHLNLNHLSLSSDQSGEALKEILRLYDFKNSESTRSVIESIQKVNISPITAPITIAQGTAMCRGSQIEITFDPRLLSGGSAFLLASVLERFLALYSSINSFTRLVARIKNQEGDLKRWPPRAGEKALL